MRPRIVQTSFFATRASNDNAPCRRKPELVTKRDAIAELLKDGFSPERASDIWRILVHAEREAQPASQHVDSAHPPD